MKQVKSKRLKLSKVIHCQMFPKIGNTGGRVPFKVKVQALLYKNDQGCFHAVVSAGTIRWYSIKLCLIKVFKKLC